MTSGCRPGAASHVHVSESLRIIPSSARRPRTPLPATAFAAAAQSSLAGHLTATTTTDDDDDEPQAPTTPPYKRAPQKPHNHLELLVAFANKPESDERERTRVRLFNEEEGTQRRMTIDPSTSKDAIALEPHPNICGTGDTLVRKTTDYDAIEEPAPFRDAAKEIVIGSIAGMVSEVFEYPFDLAKVRLQAQLLAPGGAGASQPQFRGPLDCLMQTWKQEGVSGLYRGMAAPIAGSMAVTAALFLSYSSFQSAFKTFGAARHDPNSPLPFTQLGISAAGAGAVASFVLTPIELVKCKMQVQMMNHSLHTLHTPSPAHTPVPGRIPHRSPPLPPSSYHHPHHPKQQHRSYHGAAYKAATAPHVKALSVPAPPGPLALIRTIVDAHGYRGLWLGHTGTMFRETGGSAAWFIVKEYATQYLVDRRLGLPSSNSRVASKRDMQPLAWESAVSGAAAGAAGALILYPADTVKSAIQTAEEMNSLHASPSSASSSSSSLSGARKPGVGKVGIGTDSGFWRTFGKMYKMHGVKGLYAGCGMTVARAIPSSGIIFVVYDGLNNWFA